MNLIKLLYDKYLKSGDNRFANIKVNVFWSMVIKGISILLGLVKVPILLSYLNTEKYGIWLTIASIAMWVSYFDLGLGHGLRNKLAEAIALNDKERAKGLISTAYISMSLIMICILAVLTPIIFNINWNNFLNVNTDSVGEMELMYTVYITILMFCLRFIFQLISVMLKAIQKSAISDAFLPIESILSLIFVLALRYIHPDSLFLASASLSVIPVLVLFIANFTFFRRDFSEFSISVKSFRKNYFKDIYALGFKFFLGQMCGLIVFASQNFIISKTIGAEEVTVYNIARTYYTLPLTFFTMLLTPYWSAITEAYTKGELFWIKDNMKKLKYAAIFFSIGMLLMFILSDFMFYLWVGDRVIVPLSLSISFALYNIFVMFFSPYTYFLNGVGKLTLTIYKDVFKTILFLPVAIYLTTQWGSCGILAALFFVNMIPNMIFDPIQYKKIINQTAQGIWNR